MKLFFMFFLLNLLVSFPLISNLANAQVRLKACGVDGKPASYHFTKNCNDTNDLTRQSSNNISSIQDNVICNRVNEGKSNFLIEAKRRGLACAVEYEKKAINNKNNSPSTFTSKSYSSNFNKLPNSCRNYTYSTFGYPKKSQVQNDTDDKICRFALNPMQNGWDNVRRACPFVIEAINRTFTVRKCQNLLGIKDDKSLTKSFASSLYKFSSWRVCDEVKLGKQRWLEEAIRRGLKCAVIAEAEKKKQAQLRKIADEAQKQEKPRQERIKAEQEKIKKKAAEKALKKKLAEEKARKIAEKKAKKEAEKKEKEAKKLKNKITKLKKEAEYFYSDITEFVKSGGEIDVIKLTELFSKRPKVNEKWTQKHTKDFEELQLFMYKNEAFISFEKTLKEMRMAKATADKNNTINSLNNNATKLRSLLRENFGNDELVTDINLNIKLISDVLDKKFNQKESDKVLEFTSKFLSDYFAKKKTSKVIDDKLGNKRVQLSEILKREFGSQRAQEASRLIKRIDVARSISDKKFILEELKVFLESPEKKKARLEKIEAKKREQEKLRRQAEKKKMDKLAKELEREREREQKRKLAEAKERKEKKLLGPCADISGGWGKTKCLAIWKSFPVRFVCNNVMVENDYAPIEIEIKNHDDVKIKGVFLLLSPKIIENNLLKNGTFKISFGLFGNQFIKFKVSSALNIFNTEFEQESMGMLVNRGYCTNRL